MPLTTGMITYSLPNHTVLLIVSCPRVHMYDTSYMCTRTYISPSHGRVATYIHPALQHICHITFFSICLTCSERHSYLSILMHLLFNFDFFFFFIVKASLPCKMLLTIDSNLPISPQNKYPGGSHYHGAGLV